MRKFTNKKARELFLKSLKIDEEANKQIHEHIKNGGLMTQSDHELKAEAMSLRILADDLEDGFISEDEIEIY